MFTHVHSYLVLSPSHIPLIKATILVEKFIPGIPAYKIQSFAFLLCACTWNIIVCAFVVSMASTQVYLKNWKSGTLVLRYDMNVYAICFGLLGCLSIYIIHELCQTILRQHLGASLRVCHRNHHRIRSPCVSGWRWTTWTVKVPLMPLLLFLF